VENPKNHVCPVEHANLLVGRFRAWLQDPRKILSPFVREGMTVLDLGCGPGFFSVEMARMVGGTGAVVAVDLQDGMLRKLADRIRGTGLEARIRLVKCEANAIRVTEKVDFALAFYMVHEVPDKDSFFRELKTILRAPGRALLVEPKLFHVSRREFAATTAAAERAGFEVGRGPRLALSWSAVLATAP
jgi:ubiquinone/menaquinone biosynthesis C-methylase UbiE